MSNRENDDVVVLCDGKYEFVRDPAYGLKCLRHGESWREFIGDNAVHELFGEVLRLRGELSMAQDEIESLVGDLEACREECGDIRGGEVDEAT